ncbi:hypothetical protein ECC02_011071 [Trypanosoma cruzi]|uniref:Leishmanolysin-like peptidase n=1 Tax=Trypanosoma cruzi TaxID=5693 RepID=A0A7J6XP03_TRYCR|nr:hypothetical protein ECC02_011071 [Trypanosoma cruzi]
MRRFVSTVLLFLLWLAGGPCALAEHRCIFDRVALNCSQLQTAVVQELPRGRAGAWQAYTVSTPDWAPIRIKVFAEDLKDTTKYCTVRGDVRSDFTGGRVLCRRQDVLTKEKMRIMVNRLLPEAVKLHTERLFVQPVSGVLRLPRFKLGVCGEFTVPITHHLSGVVGADMLLYAAAAPTIGGTVAWASTCVTLQDGRPAAGVLNLSPSFIAPKRESIRVVSHEIAHALGFNSILMWRLGMISRRSDVRGKAMTFVVDSNEIIDVCLYKDYFGVPLVAFCCPLFRKCAYLGIVIRPSQINILRRELLVSCRVWNTPFLYLLWKGTWNLYMETRCCGSVGVLSSSCVCVSLRIHRRNCSTGCGRVNPVGLNGEHTHGHTHSLSL